MSAVHGHAGEAPVGQEGPVLVSHDLCPYVQRCLIVAQEKGLSIRRVDISLRDKPDWFRARSPLGKVPLLIIDETQAPLFESDAICQYLDETVPGRIFASDPHVRARQRAWMAFASSVLDDIARYYSTVDEPALRAVAERIRERLGWLDRNRSRGPWFDGDRFGPVDAAFAPALRYIPVLDALVPMDLLATTPGIAAWSERLAARPSVVGAVAENYAQRLRAFLAQRDSVIGRASQFAGVG